LCIGLSLSWAACDEELPTIEEEDLFPLVARTVEVRLPFSQFGGELQTFGGFGATSALPVGIVARRFGGTLDARTLVRFGRYPTSATVRDTTGTSRSDTTLTFRGGQIRILVDTARVDGEGPITLAGGAIQAPWHPPSATWTQAVDTLEGALDWPEPGAGPVHPLGTVDWNPEEGDSVFLDVDSAMVAAWADTADLARGFRLSTDTEGARLRILSVSLVLETKPSVNPDTTVFLSVGAENLTFAYDPPPPVTENELRLGGAPSWRSTLELGLPEEIEPSPAFCAEVECPLRLDPEAVTFASLVLTSASIEAAFQPTDTLFMDVRPALAPDRLPKSPLGGPIVFGQPLPPDYFAEGEAAKVELPLTGFVRDLVRGETLRGDDAPTTLTFLSSFEPQALEYASFDGPGRPGEPFLRLIVTLSDRVILP
jgi:hypothetical protein